MRKQNAFGRLERIRRNFEYKRICEEGTLYRNGVFILTILKNNLGHHRLGLAIKASKVPLSSTRNQIKRLMREVYRLNKMKLKNGQYDILISINKIPAYRINYSFVEERLQTLLKKAGAL